MSRGRRWGWTGKGALGGDGESAVQFWHGAENEEYSLYLLRSCVPNFMQGTIHDTRRGRGHRAYNVAWDVKSTQMQTRYVHNADKILPPPLAQFLKSDFPTLLSNKDIYLPRTSLQWVEERNQSRPAAASAPCGGTALRPARARSRANERRISSDRERRARGLRQKVVHFFLAAAAGQVRLG